MGLSKIKASAVDIFNVVEKLERDAFDLADEKKELESRPTDLSAKERDKRAICARHTTVKIKDDGFLINEISNP